MDLFTRGLPGPARGPKSAGIWGLFLFLLMIGGTFTVTGLYFAAQGQSDDLGIVSGLLKFGYAGLAGAALGFPYLGSRRLYRRLKFGPGQAWRYDHPWPEDGVIASDSPGSGRLRLPPGPIVPGRPVLVELEGEGDLGGARVEMRCVREEIRRTGRHSYFERIQIAAGSVGQRQPTTAGLQLVLTAPDDGPSTELSSDPAVCWELFVADERGDFSGIFLLPVYRLPRP